LSLTGTTALMAAAMTPLALRGAWGAVAPRPERAPRWSLAVGTAILVAAVVVYPVTVVAGGTTRFPGLVDCGPAASSNPPIVVFGHEQSYARAGELSKRVARIGISVHVASDGCGELRVFDQPGSLQAARHLVRRARDAGLSATIEHTGGS